VRMTMRTVLVLLAVAAVLVALVALDATNADRAAACDDPDAASAGGLLARADKGYDEILADDPESDCALTGRRQVATKACHRARVVATGKAKAEARKLFTTLLAREPPNERPCALKGLRDTAPPPDGTDGGSRLTVVVQGEKGDKGDPGAKGDPGDHGDPGTQRLVRETKIIIYCDVGRRRACRTVG
jgi:hypothetical protein